jgi:DNA-binding XRE family transcriptional regulator
MSRDGDIAVGQNVFMAKDPVASEFKGKFIARTAKAREKAGFSQEKMAADLGVAQSKYHKYESRSLLPHYLLVPFCMLTKVTPEWMYTSAIEAKALPIPRKKKKVRKLAS